MTILLSDEDQLVLRVKVKTDRVQSMPKIVFDVLEAGEVDFERKAWFSGGAELVMEVEPETFNRLDVGSCISLRVDHIYPPDTLEVDPS